MGNGMDKILPGLYVGNLKDSMDRDQIDKNNITHILSIHDSAEDGNHKHVKYLCIKASDCANQDLQQYFPTCIEFIHKARLEGGNVLVHCLAGISRSTTIAIAYVMTVTDLSWVDAINAVRGARKITNPNFGFQRQLQNYEYTSLKTEKEKLINEYGALNEADTSHCKNLLTDYHANQTTIVNAAHSTTTQTNTNGNITVHNTEQIYPLAYNAYNLDENKRRLSKKNRLKLNENTESVKIKQKDEDTNDIKDITSCLDHLEIVHHDNNTKDTKVVNESEILDKFFK